MLLTLLGYFCAVGCVGAAEKIVSRVTEEKTDQGKKTLISFAYASCEEECQIATLTCEEWGAISVVLADVDAKTAAKAITQDQKQMVLRVGKKTFDYTITALDYMELTGSWWLTAFKNDSNARDLAPAIANAKVVDVRVGNKTVMVPVDAPLKAWALACK